MRQRNAFTLVELLVALTMFAVLSTALVVALRQGIHTWGRLDRLSEHQAQVRFLLDRLQRDASAAVLLTGANDTPPLLTERTLGLVTVRTSAEGQPPQLEDVLVRAETQSDQTLALVRRVAPYPAPPDGPLGRAQVLLPRLQNCRWAYLYYNPMTRRIVWRSAWDSAHAFPDALPRGIRLTVQLATGDTTPLVFVYDIPTGVPGFTEESQ